MSKKLAPPRSVPNWDEFYMGLCFMFASGSKDPSTQHGSIVVDGYNRPMGWGYNGTSRKISDNQISWKRPEKYPFIVHAEENAVSHCPSWTYDSLDNFVAYITGMPCPQCMKMLVNKGLRKVVYGPQGSKMVDEDAVKIVKELVKLSGITLELFKGNCNWMRDRIVYLISTLPELFN